MTTSRPLSKWRWKVAQSECDMLGRYQIAIGSDKLRQAAINFLGITKVVSNKAMVWSWRIAHLGLLSSQLMLLFGSLRTWSYRTCHDLFVDSLRSSWINVASTLHRSRSFKRWLTTLVSTNVVAESKYQRTGCLWTNRLIPSDHIPFE